MTAPIIAEIASKVSKFAPLLGSVLGSPVAGVALSLIGNYFGVDTNDVKKILEVVNNDPDAMGKLKALEMQHKETLQQIASTNFSIEVSDRSNARAREISLHDFVPTFLAIGFLINYAAIQFYCITHNNAVNDIISARFQDVLIMIMSYYFGSSHKNAEVK